MQLNISGHHLDITDAINDYVVNKLSVWSAIMIASPAPMLFFPLTN